MKISLAIRGIMNERDISVTALASASGLDRSSLSKALNGKGDRISLQTLVKVAHGLGVDPIDIVAAADHEAAHRHYVQQAKRPVFPSFNRARARLGLLPPVTQQKNRWAK